MHHRGPIAPDEVAVLVVSSLCIIISFSSLSLLFPVKIINRAYYKSVLFICTIFFFDTRPLTEHYSLWGARKTSILLGRSHEELNYKISWEQTMRLTTMVYCHDCPVQPNLSIYSAKSDLLCFYGFADKFEGTDRSSFLYR